jgi:hypothetical protein
LPNPRGRRFRDSTLIFLLLWLPWSQFAWSANAVAGNTREVRLLFLTATAASVPMAASISTAFDQGGGLFAIPLAIIFLSALAMMILGLAPDSVVRRSAIRYATPNIARDGGDRHRRIPRRRRPQDCVGHRHRDLRRCDSSSGWQRVDHPSRTLRRASRADHHRRARRGDRCPR